MQCLLFSIDDGRIFSFIAHPCQAEFTLFVFDIARSIHFAIPSAFCLPSGTIKYFDYLCGNGEELTTPGDIARGGAQVQRSGLPFAGDVFTKCVCVSVAVHGCSLSCALLCSSCLSYLIARSRTKTNRPRGASIN